ncbi:MAG: glycosyl hydrolase 115 family protein [Bacteroidota bacterium]|nr:glycosyl hydrolase 115 family protein [Bacteroidota bacterium]
MGVFLLLFVTQLHAQNIVTDKKEAGAFALVSADQSATILVDENDDSLVQKAAQWLAKDVEMVTGKKPNARTSVSSAKNIIVIGNIQKSKFIQELIREKKLNADRLQNKWEAYQIEVIKAPFKGVEQALVIAGSDRRGTAYGVFELSKQMGVSPWGWWADVPVKKKKEIYVKANTFLSDAPKVKYRGIFINDEAPALSGWSKEKFGGFNHLFYEKVFELILRLKGNYLWPAMWGNAFYDDDPLNKQTADTYGIVIGTSHHEPLMRAHDEWRRYGTGKWNYDSNAVRLQQFWKEGMQRATNEKIVSIGMRGDGDEPMTQGTAIALLERIVADQRKIIEDVTGKPAAATPQLWALYKEVQDYYDKGMRVPDDVTLLLCDDNWGNIRKLPKLTDQPRSGGYGIYYHFDYVGGPRNYKWINTNNIARVWEQMHLAYAYGVDKIWIVNVGDIKPMEFPTSFFLDYAWNPDKWNGDNLRTYYTQWAEQQFGGGYAKEIGDLLRKYAQYSARRKPELLDANTYSLTHYNEADRVVKEWKDLETQAEKINQLLPAEYRDAFFQLVLHPVKAFANLHELYVSVARNRLYAAKNLPEANAYAQKAKQFYINDSLLTQQYHHIAGGKWNHMMDQTHIGYTYWQQPPVNKMPEVKYVSMETAVDSGFVFNTSAASAKNTIAKNTGNNRFTEQDGVVSMEAEYWTRAVNTQKIKWKVIPDIGRTGSGITTFPVTTSTPLTASGPHVEYDFFTNDSGKLNINLYFSPTLNFHNDEGLKFAVSVDNEEPKTITLNKEDNNVQTWGSWVANNIIIKNSEHTINKPGKHVLKYWMISPAVVLQKLVIDLGGLKPSYLGPPETKMQ